jgi:hypothetical protein
MYRPNFILADLPAAQKIRLPYLPQPAEFAAIPAGNGYINNSDLPINIFYLTA